MRSSEHVALVSALHMAWSLLLLVGSVIALVALAISGLCAGFVAGDGVFAGLAAVIGLLASFLLLIASVAGFVGAFGLIKHRYWARYVLLVLGVVWLVKIPLGTALGVYTFYVLTRRDVVEQLQ